jgi:hypothetical protein
MSPETKMLLVEKIPLAAVSGFPYLHADSTEFEHISIYFKTEYISI